jgi:hypothetical protein
MLDNAILKDINSRKWSRPLLDRRLCLTLEGSTE